MNLIITFNRSIWVRLPKSIEKKNIESPIFSELKPAAHNTYFFAGLLAGLEFCHHIGCDADIAANTMARF